MTTFLSWLWSPPDSRVTGSWIPFNRARCACPRVPSSEIPCNFASLANVWHGGVTPLSVVTSPFSFLILLIWFFSVFFLMSLPKGLSIFSLLKETAFSFINLYYCFFHFFLFISAQIFMISFLLLILEFFCSSFSSCFRCKVRLSIWCFFWFVEVGLYCYKLPS